MSRSPTLMLAGIHPLNPITTLLTLRILTPTPRVTPLPLTTPNDLDRSLLDYSPPKSTELRETTSLLNSMVSSSTLEIISVEKAEGRGEI